MKRTFLSLAIVGVSLIFLSKSVRGQEGAWINIGPTKWISSVTTTPWGLLVGEHDGRGITDSYNGVFMSKNLGETWQPAGLQNRRITDVYYNEGRIYVASKQTVEGKNGVFVSDDGAKTWAHQSGLNFSTATVAADGDTVLVGAPSRGLWVSFDAGETWEQRLGDGTFGPTIDTIKLSNGLFFVAGNNKVYKSVDFGDTWDEISFFTGKNIRSIELGNNIVLAGAPSSDGLFRSVDYGQTWNNVQNWGSNPVGSLLFFDKVFYAGKSFGSGEYGVFRSDDNGLTWQDTTLRSNGPINDLNFVNIGSKYLFAVTQYQGIFRNNLPIWTFPLRQFLNIPWIESSFSKMFDKITAVFDHTYPLLGYIFRGEPVDENDTTTDFYGNKLARPQLYYSSHNGVDFALPLGTEITAPASGYASYYYCDDCGHTIKIDHQNGYQTSYMHLQSEGLIIFTAGNVWVNVGDVIGKVGMTGRTSGPHLHFSVLKDANGNGTFSDDFPHGLVDPFGWQSGSIDDPWELYTWLDSLGTHTGTRSLYLWNFVPEGFSTHIDETGGVVTHANKKLYFPPGVLDYGFGVKVQSYLSPVLKYSQNHLSYIFGTSTLITSYNYLGELIENFDFPVEIEIDFSEADLANVLEETIKIYRFNPLLNLWEPLNTLLLDLSGKTVSAETWGFSQFAVFGEKLDSDPPVTEIFIEGEKSGDWFVQYPTISFDVQDVPHNAVESKTYYKVADEVDWYEYTQPLVIEREGVFGIEFKSVDEVGNWEDVQDILLKVSISGRPSTTNTVFSMIFEF
jgi:murein DD-endopeptidase MepM/ murein hydrolase activator NlpD